MDQNQNNIPQEEQEIDLVALIKKLWLNKGLIIKLTAVFMVVGVLVALFSSKVYTASCDVVPQVTKTKSGNMSTLAKLAGVDLGQDQSTKMLSPYVYENVMKSTTFRKELMQTKIDFEKADRPVSFYEYYTSEEFNKPNIIDYIKKYTIGLPYVILNAIKGEETYPDYAAIAGEKSSIETVSKTEYDMIQLIGSCVSIMVDDKNGYVTIIANMPEALAAAQLAQATVTLLQDYITKFKIEKVQSNLEFIQGRYDEAKKVFEEVQSRRAKFKDANHNSVKYSARVEQEKLDAEYKLAMNLYGELSTKLEQARIDVKENTPMLTIISPVTVPYNKTKPQRAMILAAFTFLGFAAGAGLVFMSQTLAQFVGEERVGKYIKELPEEE